MKPHPKTLQLPGPADLRGEGPGRLLRPIQQSLAQGNGHPPEWLEGTGHDSDTDASDTVNRLIEAFLDRKAKESVNGWKIDRRVDVAGRA